MVKEIYCDYDDKSPNVILSDIDLFRSVCPHLKYKIFRSTPGTERYHLMLYNLDMPMHVALEIMRRTQTDPKYIALVQFKREFFMRNSTRYESDGTVTPPPVLIMEG